MINFKLSIFNLKIILWIYEDLAKKDLDYFYHVPFFFIIRYKMSVPFSFGIVKKIETKKTNENKWTVQLIHSKIFQRTWAA